MLLQYPKLSSASNLIHYEDYRKMHHNYIQLYKALYEDIATFSLLPEKFIDEAEPVIENYLSKPAVPGQNQQQLEIITDFISRFNKFMDEATEMFMEHQLLSDRTIAYMERVTELNKKHSGKYIIECEEEYLQCIPELNLLEGKLKFLREKADVLAYHLNQLKPGWEKIKEAIARGG